MITYHYDIEQNTPEWDEIRRGKMTGSKASVFLVNGNGDFTEVMARDLYDLNQKREYKNLTAIQDKKRTELIRRKGLPFILAEGAKTYIYRKAAEWITNQSPYNFSNQFTENGHDNEVLGNLEYQDQTFSNVLPVGFVSRNDYCGCSPDGLVDHNKIIEGKCLEQAEHMRIIDLGLEAVDSAYIAQIQFNMWVCGRPLCDHWYYHRKFLDKKLIVFEIEADPVMWERFEWAEKLFIQEVDRLTGLVLQKELI
jgi:hypothetical protein